MGRADDQIHGKWSRYGQPDFNGLIDLVACTHDYKQIDVATFVWRPVCMRAEEDNPIRIEMLGNPASVPSYRRY
jgi:hypothetical protein